MYEEFKLKRNTQMASNWKTFSNVELQILQLTNEMEKLKKTINANQQAHERDIASVRELLEQHLNKTFFKRD